MQTFLPFSSFHESAQALDNKRLGKQRVEAWQIYQALTLPKYGWKNHPAVKQWKGCEWTLIVYGGIVCTEWRHRGFKDSLIERFREASGVIRMTPEPWWLYLDEYHDSHKRMLLEKDYEWYSKQFGAIETERVMKLPAKYWWPSQHKQEAKP